MKKLFVLGLSAVVAFTLAVGIGASDEVVKKGTATVDGVLDDAYTGSLVLRGLGTDARPDSVPSDTWNGTCSADAYFMYDDEYLYICAVVTDDDVLSAGEEYAKSGNAISNDVIEFKISRDGTNTVYKTSIDAYGYCLFGNGASESVKYATKITDTGYVAEIAIPCVEGNLDIIKAGKMGVMWQINDLDAEGTVGQAYNFYTAYPATGSNGNTPTFYNLSSEAAVSSAPKTFDPTLIAVVLTAASGAAFVVASKKH